MRKREKEALERKQYRARLDYNNAFNKENYKQIAIRLSTVNDADIIEFLSNFDSNKEIICIAIRKEMKRLKRSGKKNKTDA